MVIQYGQRDEDDESEYDSDDERNRKGLFGGMMQHAKRNSNGGKKGVHMPGMGLAALSQLGASVSSQIGFGGGHQSGDDLSDDEDNKSVSSKAKMALKSFGDSMRFTRTKSDDENDSDSSDEEEDSDDDDSDSGDEMDDDRSVASRTAQAVRKVTGKLTKVLRVGRRSDDEDDDSSVSDSESSDEEEEDPLATTKSSSTKKSLLPNMNLLGKGFGSSREMKADDSDDSNNSGGGAGARGGNRLRNTHEPESQTYLSPFRRSKTDQASPAATKKQSPGFHRCQTTESRAVYAKAAAQTLAQEQYDTPPTSRRARQARNHQTQSLTDPRDKSGPVFGRSNTTMSASRNKSAQAAAKVLAKEQLGEEVWSMNVTEDMLAKATSQGVYVPPSVKP